MRFRAALLFSTLLSTADVQAGELEKAIASFSGSQANFTQRFTPQGFKNAQTERGSVVFGAPPKMRWNYAGSEARTFIFNGTTSWLYSPADKQVIVNEVTAAELRALPLAFLWNSGATRDYTTTESRRGGKTVVLLKPKSKAASLRNISVTIGRGSAVEVLEYVDQNGNKTRFDFSGHRKTSVSDATFQFKAPVGVVVVRN